MVEGFVFASASSRHEIQIREILVLLLSDRQLAIGRSFKLHLGVVLELEWLGDVERGHALLDDVALVVDVLHLLPLLVLQISELLKKFLSF